MDKRAKRRTQTQRQKQDDYASTVFKLIVFLSLMKVETSAASQAGIYSAVVCWNRLLVFTDCVLLVRCFLFPGFVSPHLWLFSWLPMFLFHACLIISPQPSSQPLSDCQSLKLMSGVKSSYLDVSITSVLFCPCFICIPLMFSMCLPVLSVLFLSYVVR